VLVVSILTHIILDELQSMLILKEHCVFVPDKREEGERFIYIVQLTRKNAIIKVKDFSPDETFIHSIFVKMKLFMANTRKFIMVDLSKQDLVPEGETRVFDIEKLGLKIWETTISAPLKMHCFFSNNYSDDQDYAMCAVELEDN